MISVQKARKARAVEWRLLAMGATFVALLAGIYFLGASDIDSAARTIQASAGTAQCGDTPQNPCMFHHLQATLSSFASLFPDWVVRVLGNL